MRQFSKRRQSSFRNKRLKLLCRFLSESRGAGEFAAGGPAADGAAPDGQCLMGSAWRSVWVYIMKSCSALPCLRRFFLVLMENQALFRLDRGQWQTSVKMHSLVPESDEGVQMSSMRYSPTLSEKQAIAWSYEGRRRECRSEIWSYAPEYLDSQSLDGQTVAGIISIKKQPAQRAGLQKTLSSV